MGRQLDVDALPALARGCAVLGTGGGGEVYAAELMARQALEDHGPVPVVDLAQLPDDGLLMPLSEIGAPVVSLEKIPHGEEGARLRAEIEMRLQAPVVALMCSEIGGSNGLLPVTWAARLGLPLVDADGMGRALPNVEMVAMHVAGLQPGMIAMTDPNGSVVTLRAVSGPWAERIARTVTVAFGGIATIADYVMRVDRARGAVIEGSVSRALAIGRAVLDAAGDPVAALIDEVSGVRLLDGKVVEVERHLTGGFVEGNAAIEGLGSYAGRLLRLEIQNENLVAFEEGRVVACVPDLITVLDAETGDAIATELLRFGQRVTAIAFPCAPLWRTPRGLEVAGPRAFGYDFDYVELERAGTA